MNNTQQNNEREISIVKEVALIVSNRKIKIIGIAIILGLVMVYAFALFVPVENSSPDMVMFNYISLIACFVLCFTSFNVRKILLKRVNSKNFSAHILPFAQCDLGGLLCIITNLTINQNFIFATTGLFLSVFFILINFPRSNDIKNQR
jgi:amino acid transporter